MLLHRALELGWIYELLQRHIGSADVRRYFAKHYVQANADTDILDLGCGPGTMLGFLPKPKSYLGLDSNPRYIQAGAGRHGPLYEFRVADISAALPAGSQRFDIAIAMGVLHHLPDEVAIGFLRNAFAALRPQGRLITLDGAYRYGQPFLARLLNRLDRGDFVRTDAAYEALARSVFSEVRVFDYCGRLIVPVSHCVMVCVKPPVAS